MSNRSICFITYLISLFSSVVVGLATLSFYQDYHFKIFIELSKLSLILFIALLAIAIAFVLANKGFKNSIQKFLISYSLEQNLISLGAYYKSSNDKFFYLPKITINLDKSTITIKIDDLKIRQKIETYQKNFSSALPNYLIVDNSYFDSYGNNFIIEFHNERKFKAIKYNSIADYFKHIDTLKSLFFEFDNRHQVNLLDYPHWLISGSTGSGKSFLTQLLLLQFIRKQFEVIVLDVKKSYTAFSKIVDYETEPELILKKIELVASEMRERQNKLSDALLLNPRAVAVDFGYKPIILIIEEFIGLKTLLNKEQVKQLDNYIKEISVLSRSVNIHLFIIAQSSSVDLIDSSIKNNLNKVFLGYLASNIAISTFGNGVDIPTFTKLEKGYGYIQLDRIEQIKVPNLIYSVDELMPLYKEPNTAKEAP